MQILKMSIYKKNNPNYFKVLLDENIDDCDFCIIHADLIVKYQLSTNMHIDTEKLKSIKQLSENMRAQMLSIKYLSSRLKTAKQLQTYLKGKLFNSESIEYAISKMLEYKLLDDTHFADCYIRSKQKSKSKNYIKNQLMTNGIKKDTIVEMLENFDDYDSACAACEKFLKSKIIDAKTIEKLHRHLLYKGYDYSTITKIIDKIKTNN